ncbi:MAG: agmatine deiminase family protein [Actinomycetota bacterium]
MSSMPHQMPAEFEPHQRTLMCWPSRDDIWDGQIAEAERAYAELANTIAVYEPVTMVVDPKHIERAESLCASAINLLSIPIDDSWCRDSGPIYVREKTGELIGLDFVFNGWGEKFIPHDQDAQLASRVTTRLNHKKRSIPAVLEGGSINVDGAGTLVTTMQCLLHPNRNPTMSQVKIEALLKYELGVSSVVWLPHGLALDHDTDGHVDNVAAFTAPGHVLLQGCNDKAEDDYVRMFINEKVARSSISGNGEQLKVDVIPVLPFVEGETERVVVPYLNFYVGNKFVVVPVTGHDADTDMLQMIGEFFPDRDILPIQIGRILAVGGGGIHCITQQVPA